MLAVIIYGGNMSDFINIFDYRNKDYPFQIFIGGRGTGKTYSGLSGCLDKALVPGKFIYMRRTANELETITDDVKKGEGANPFKPINKDKNRNLGFMMLNKNLAGLYERDTDENGKLLHIGAPIGYGVALSTIASIRGIDFSDCSDWIYDEFIKEKHVRAIKDEAGALLNAYESINRNREFFGEPPIRLWLLANSNDIYNPIFSGLGIVSEVEKMIRAGKHDRYFKDRGLAIHLLAASKSFVDKKKETALYKLTRGTQFYDMALENKFAYNDFSLIGYRKTNGFTPVCKVGDGYLYKRKDASELYFTYQSAHVPVYKTQEKQDELRFRSEIGVWVYPYFIKGLITFESYDLKEQLIELIM